MTADGDRGDKWNYQPGDLVPAQCVCCARLSSGAFGTGCRAFPGGIPEEILENRFDHRRPHPDENEPFRFEARADVDPRDLESLYRALDGLK